MSGWVMVLLGQGAITAGSWLLSRHFGWEVAVALALIIEGAIGAVYGMLSVGTEAEPWHGGALDRAEDRR
jgi:ribose/xylose/arabinose/galactoside ABC-type transport system permease subunit